MTKKKLILYTKNDKGRYEEYKPKICDDGTLYRRLANGKYVATNMLVDRDLPEGVWVVKRTHGTCYTSSDFVRTQYALENVSDLQNPILNLNTAQLGKFDKIVEEIMYKDEYRNGGKPWQDSFKKAVAEIISELTKK